MFLNELQKLNSEQNYPQRGVYLARLELYSRLKENAYKYMGKIIFLINNLILIQYIIHHPFLVALIFFKLEGFVSSKNVPALIAIIAIIPKLLNNFALISYYVIFFFNDFALKLYSVF